MLGEQNGYNIPELSPAPEVEFILSEEGGNRLRANPNLNLSAQAKRLVSDSYICFYQSKEVQMYNWGKGGGGEVVEVEKWLMY